MLAPEVTSTVRLLPQLLRHNQICYPTYPCQYTQLLDHYCLQLPSLELQRQLYQWVLNGMNLNRDRGEFTLVLLHPVSSILY